MQIRQAQKSKSKLRIGLAGPSGSGKTYSALLLASGLTNWRKICVIDTENMSADLYSDLGPYNVLTLEAPFSPERYVEAIKSAEDAGMEVIIIDSITHEWSGTGGCLQIQEKLGGRWQDWAKVTPMHERFKDAILNSRAHVITSVRSKTDWSMSEEGGKTKIQKVGLKQETREGFEYELTLSLDININHLTTASKDRTGLFMDADPFIITQETGKKLLEWANKGLDTDKLAKTIEKLMPIKGVAIQKTLDFYKVTNLSELAYPKLKMLESRLNEMPDKVKPAVSVEKDEALDETTEEVEPEKEPEKKKEPVKPTKGQLKMLEVLIRRRAKQAKKGYEVMLSTFLRKIKAKSLDDLDADTVKKLTNIVNDMNKEKEKPATIEDAEKIFNSKATGGEDGK